MVHVITFSFILHHTDALHFHVNFSERKISFVLHEPDNESEGSSKSNVTIPGEDLQTNDRARRMTTAPGRPFLLRRGTAANVTTGSFKRRSLKLRRNTKEGKDIEVEACKFCRKIF